MSIYLIKKSQIFLLPTNKVFIKVLFQYLDYTNLFLFDFIIKLPKNFSINKYIIKMVKSKQLFFGLIYSLKLIE